MPFKVGDIIRWRTDNSFSDKYKDLRGKVTEIRESLDPDAFNVTYDIICGHPTSRDWTTSPEKYLELDVQEGDASEEL